MSIFSIFKPKKSVPPVTGKVFPAGSIDTNLVANFGPKIGPWASTPDLTYAEVSAAWIPVFYAQWRQRLFDRGVVAWDAKFDCNRFAASFCADAQVEYYKHARAMWIKGQAIAVGEIWYVVRNGGGGHAIVCAITDKGPLFIEPQTGAILTLTPVELQSISFKRF